jgi:predicted Zn-dependent peptidase
MNLREKHGFTYGSYSRVGSGRYQSQFTASAAVRTDKVDSAIAEMIHEILNMRDGKITAEELEIAKAKYNGSFALKMEDPATTANYASNILINNLPKNFYSVFLQKINAVTIDDIQRVAKNYFSEDRGRVVIVGNAKKYCPTWQDWGIPLRNTTVLQSPLLTP